MSLFPFNTGVPNAPNNPSVDQPDMQTNNVSTAGLVAVDHIGFGVNNGGYHNVAHWNDQLTIDPAKIPGVGQSYTRTVAGDQQLIYQSGNGVINQITPAIPLRAYANFNGSSVNGGCTVNSQFNVTSVSRTALGVYQIVFTTAMPSVNYVIDINGFLTAAPLNAIVVGGVFSGGFVVNSLNIKFVLIPGNLINPATDPTTACFKIYGG